MKRVICIPLILIILINTCVMEVFASSSSSESKNIEEANMLLKDLEDNSRDYYRQFSTFDEPVFVNIAKSYLDNKPQFYRTNAWSDILNEEYRRKGPFKNEYIYDLIIMGFLKFEAEADTYNDSLINREKDFATDLYSVLGDEVKEVFDKSTLSDSTWENFYNSQTINDLNLALSIVDYAGESIESYCNIVASKMALLESKRDKLALFRASVEEASNYDDKDYINAMNLIIDSIDKADPTKYLNKKTGVECTNVLISVVEDVVKEVNPIFAVLDLSVSGIDLLFGSSDSASNDIKLAYLYLADVYLHQGLRSIAKEFMDSNYNDPSKRSSESARQFIDAFKTYLRFQQYGNNYADEWLDNYIQVRSGFIKRWFHKKEIQNAKDMKEQCKDENTTIDNMLKNINALEKEEDVWKIIPEKKEEEVSINNLPFSEERLNEISQVAIYQCMEKDLGEWIPEINDKEAFWDAMCFYCDFTYGIYNVDYPRAGEDGQYQIIPNELLRNAAYALYKDFDGNLPTIDDNIWRATYYDDMSTGIIVGDNAPFIITSESYAQNEDGTIDAEYVTEYWDGSSAGNYKVHFEPNSHYNEVDADVTYYYCVSFVKRIGKESVLEDNTSAESSHEEYQEVINEYRSAYDNFELYQEDSSAFMEKYPLVNVNALIEPYLSSMDPTFFSAIKDINEDGVDELIIGVDAEHPNSIYTFYGGKIIPLINDIGERSYINIYDDGTIYRYDSGGAAFGIATIYEINENGDGLNTIKQFEADWDRDPDYPYYDGAESLSQEQFNAEYLDKNEMEFNWSE